MTRKIITTAGGDELYEEDIEALADEAERGYDLERAERVAAGRPPLGAAGHPALRSGAGGPEPS
ncbi:MAG TPA: hypothetical protein VFY36_06050 [Solirubrobacteraceae bacterium]|nr:hypothetical protein [Solirubrobacteraceae bacterium]